VNCLEETLSYLSDGLITCAKPTARLMGCKSLPKDTSPCRSLLERARQQPITFAALETDKPPSAPKINSSGLFLSPIKDSLTVRTMTL